MSYIRITQQVPNCQIKRGVETLITSRSLNILHEEQVDNDNTF
jgi:hypothetical protein